MSRINIVDQLVLKRIKPAQVSGHSPDPLQDPEVQRLCQEVVSGDREQEGLAEQHGAAGAARLLGVPLPEVHRQVHLLAVLLLHLVPAWSQDTSQGQVRSVCDALDQVRSGLLVKLWTRSGLFVMLWTRCGQVC